MDHAPNTRSIICFALGKVEGFDVLACASGPEALEAAVTFAPDLLLLDVGMPGMDGIATLEQLRARGIGAPVVFFTSHVQPAELKRYRALGAMGTIAKPFDPLKVARRLRELWRNHHEPAKA